MKTVDSALGSSRSASSIFDRVVGREKTGSRRKEEAPSCVQPEVRLFATAWYWE